MSSVLVTTGATITFKPLVKYVLSSTFIQSIIDYNITKLTIQYGNEISGDKHISTEYFEKYLTEETIHQFGLEFESQQENIKIYTSNKYQFTLVCFPFSCNICDYIDKSNIVVSHAGTGSIIDTLKLHKPLIVVTNSELMDNHQDEIANEFSCLNYCLKLSSDDLLSSQLPLYINQILKKEIKFELLEDQDNSTIANIIYSEL